VELAEPAHGRSVFVVQSLSQPATKNLFELLLFADACRRSAASRVTAIVPYLGYARADKRHQRREPLTASLVATLLEASGGDPCGGDPRCADRRHA
jgi:ribose-phosphate pyrophosphokinase